MNPKCAFDTENKKVHLLIACQSHSAKLEKIGWKLKNSNPDHEKLGCDICEKGFKKAVAYAETGWYE